MALKETEGAGSGIPFTVDLSFGHTFASALIAAGVDVVRVSTVLGHAKVSTTLDTYAAQFNARGAHDMGDVIGAAFGRVGE